MSVFCDHFSWVSSNETPCFTASRNRTLHFQQIGYTCTGTCTYLIHTWQYVLVKMYDDPKWDLFVGAEKASIVLHWLFGPWWPINLSLFVMLTVAWYYSLAFLLREQKKAYRAFVNSLSVEWCMVLLYQAFRTFTRMLNKPLCKSVAVWRSSRHSNQINQAVGGSVDRQVDWIR